MFDVLFLIVAFAKTYCQVQKFYCVLLVPLNVLFILEMLLICLGALLIETWRFIFWALQLYIHVLLSNQWYHWGPLNVLMIVEKLKMILQNNEFVSWICMCCSNNHNSSLLVVFLSGSCLFSWFMILSNILTLVLAFCFVYTTCLLHFKFEDERFF